MATERTEHVDLVAMLSGMLGAVRELSLLPSGVGGRSYRVDCDSGRYVAKLFRADSHVLLGPAAQYALLGPLARAGIAPEPIACDEAAGLLVTRFLDDAMAVSSRELSTPAHLAAAAGLLGRLHGTAIAVPQFAPLCYADRYVGQLGGEQNLLPADRALYRELCEVVADLDFAAACLCHNDLIADNLMLGPRPKLIDFDYAVAAPPVLDLASLVVMNGFSQHEASLLLEAYCAGVDGPLSRSEFVRVQRLVRLLNHFWALASPPAGARAVARYRIRDD